MTMEEECISPPRGQPRPRSLSPPVLVKSYRPAQSPTPSVNNWRRRPLGRYNGQGSSDRWIKNGSSKVKPKLDENRDDQVSDCGSEFNPARYQKAAVVAKTLVVARLTREYWDTRRNLSNAAARGMSIENQLSTLAADIKSSPDFNFSEQIGPLGLTLVNERTKLEAAAKLLEDVLRECENPVVVPELLKLAEMYDEDE
ncbi:hypothetical protein B0H14DRAFT_3456424 [Mycena olivaceomarginata]|nr:hypothetical protein B0H14DRAFT_3456424 [Mycena olivaceomarginata]